jgi:hypothetical protein
MANSGVLSCPSNDVNVVRVRFMIKSIFTDGVLFVADRAAPPSVKEPAVRRAEQRRELKRQRSNSAERSGSTLDVGNGDPKGVTPEASAV